MKKLFIFAIPVLLLTSCTFFGGERVEGNGTLAADDRDVSGFSNVELNGSTDVVLAEAQKFTVKVTGDQNLLPYVLTEIDGKTLKIRIKKGYNLHPDKHLMVFVSAPVFNNIEVNGSGDLNTENTLNNEDEMHFASTGSGNITAKVNTPSVEGRTTGSGNISFSGKTSDLDVSVTGAGDIHCFSLTSENARIKINGSGNADVYASKKLALIINGSGDIQYKGGGNVDSHINGSGSVSKAD